MYAREQISLLGYLGQGWPDPAIVDGPIGTNMVALPGGVHFTELDPKRYVLLNRLGTVGG